MRYLKLTAAVVALSTLLSACGKTEGETEVAVPLEQQPVELAGAVAAGGAKKGVSQAVGDALNGVAQSGAAGNASSHMAPPDEVFMDGGSTATAPSYGPKGEGDTTVVLTAWEGPLEGPDGEQGWYRRTWSYTYLNQNLTPPTDTTDVYSYWFRTEPESNFVAGGWSNVDASVIHYGWTAESAIWGGSTWLMDLHFVQPTQNSDGETVPSAIAGSWHWWVDARSGHYANTVGNGQFRYGFSSQEDGWRGFQEALTGEALQNMAVGATLGYHTDVTSSWQFDILLHNYDNELAADIFGGGAGTYEIALDVTRESQTSYYLGFHFEGTATGYIGTGEMRTDVDYLVEPAFAADVTPPGELWGTSYSDALSTDDDHRDGLIYWYNYLYDISNFSRTGVGESSVRQYSKSLSLVFTGAKYENISCSSPDVAPDCPEDSGNSNP